MCYTASLSKGRLESQRRSVPLWQNPDRKLCLLSFPIAQSNRSPDIQYLLQWFKFLNNISMTQLDRTRSTWSFVPCRTTDSVMLKQCFHRKKSISSSTKNSPSQSIKSFRLTYWGINEQFRLQKQFKRPFSLRDWPD